MYKLTRAVINLSSKQVDSVTCSLLSKGLNFAAITLAMIPCKDIICGVEAALVDLPQEEAEEVRSYVVQLLETSVLAKALRAIRKDESLVILKTDKGNAAVIMATQDNQKKLQEVRNDTAFKKIKKDPIAKI